MGIMVLILTLAISLLLTTVSHAASKPRMILVGGSAQSWKVPDSPNNNTLNHWAEQNRFKVGDILVWKYDGKVDSVLQVTKEDYDNCNTAKPLKQFNDGDTKFELDNSGAYFFISGVPDHCIKGEKITIVVLAERNSGGGSGGNPNVSPASSPQGSTQAPAPAHNDAVGLKVGSGLFFTAVAIGLAMA